MKTVATSLKDLDKIYLLPRTEQETRKVSENMNESIIDGSNLTVNSDIKYVRKRHVSEVKRGRKSAKVQDFLNWCKFLVREKETCNRPTAMLLTVMSAFRTNKLDTIPVPYKLAIDLNLDLVTRASQVNLGTGRPLYIGEDAKKLEKKAARGNFSPTDFIHWCRFLVGEEQSCSRPPKAFTNILSYFRKGQMGSISLKYRYPIKANKDLVWRASEVDQRVMKFTYLEDISKEPTNKKLEAKAIVPIEKPIKKVKKPKKIKDIKRPSKPIFLEENPDYTENVNKEESLTIEQLIAELKQKGAKEIILKF